MIGRTVWVSCDGTESGVLCDEEVALQGERATATAVRQEARRLGWRIGRLDLCPTHCRAAVPMAD